MANTPDHHKKNLLDLCFEPDPHQALREQVPLQQPGLIAISMRNIQNNDYSGLADNLEYYAKLIGTLREISDAPIVLGGAGFSVMPAQLMEHLKPDFGISGEGEQAFPKLVTALENNGEGIDAIGALFRRENHKVISNPRPPEFLDMNTLINPDRRLVSDVYFSDYGVESIQTKRGCPLRCDYCTYPIIEGRVGRTREPAAIVDEMFESLEHNPDINHFFIVDSVFNLPRTHAKNVCKELISRDWKTPWTCYANPLGFDQEFADLAKAAGCAGMEVGSDSGVDRVLKNLHKGFTTEHIRNMHEMCVKAEVPDCHTFIIGTEGESMADVQETLNFMDELNPFSAQIMIWIDDYESLDPDYRTERLAFRKDIEALLEKNRHLFPRWCVPALKINFSERLFKALRRSGLHGPLWQHVDKIGA